MAAFAMYRLPYAETYTKITQTDGEPMEIFSYSRLACQVGFCIAPFSISDDCPILVIRPDLIEEKRVPSSPSDVSVKESVGSLGSKVGSLYSETFARFHEVLKQGDFRKLVLARCAEEEIAAGTSLEDLFFSTCQLYPRTFVALVSAPKSGIWLAATPEILLKGSGCEWQTMALAGTMRLEGAQLDFDTPKDCGIKAEITWSTKNIQEQHYVATYIKDCLLQFADDICEEGPTTVRAGNLVHLRSDFRFRLAPDANIGNLIEALHPTPAVCGLPKHEACKFIIDNENMQRRYYSGFMGPLNVADSTHLYVSLRCMQITGSRCRLYAGGGLLKDSIEEQEWNETEAKLETMRRCIAIKKM
ncbi:MAG: isochorismate synthase [Prevotella sp.]|nr:isochorismate synthase [Prevotella sp.]